MIGVDYLGRSVPREGLLERIDAVAHLQTERTMQRPIYLEYSNFTQWATRQLDVEKEIVDRVGLQLGK